MTRPAEPGTNGAFLHNGPIIHAGGYEQITGTTHNPDESIRPKFGTGIELLYVKDDPAPSTANGYGVLQAYSRDVSAFRDLGINGKNITLTANGGRVNLPAGTAQTLLGSWDASSGWSIPQAGTWIETEVRLNCQCSGGPLRIEFTTTVEAGAGSPAGSAVYLAIGYDGGLPWMASQVVSTPAPGYACPMSGFLYRPAADGIVGLHRFSLFMHASVAGAHFTASVGTRLYVTELRA